MSSQPSEDHVPSSTFDNLPVSVQEFLEHWLPTQFAREGKPVEPRVCSLLLDFGGTRAYWIGIQDGAVVTRLVNGTAEALLRLDTSIEAFQTLVVAASRGEGARNPALRLLQVDPAAAEELSAARGAVRLVVQDEQRAHELVVSAGSERLSVACTLYCNVQDLRELQSGAVQALDLFVAGKLRVEGDLQTGLTLGSLFI
jgi:SCP-2 sterol transfer family